MFDPTTSIVHMTCPCCGAQELRPSALHVTVFDVDKPHRIAFFCPGCTEEITHLLSAEACQFLIHEMGVGYAYMDVPAEALEEKTGPPISPDDVLEFALRIRGITPMFSDEGLAEEIRVVW